MKLGKNRRNEKKNVMKLGKNRRNETRKHLHKL